MSHKVSCRKDARESTSLKNDHDQIQTDAKHLVKLPQPMVGLEGGTLVGTRVGGGFFADSRGCAPHEDTLTSNLYIDLPEEGLGKSLHSCN